MSRSTSKAERLNHIEQLLLSNTRGIRKADIARRLGVHRSTAGRDIEELCRRLPIWESDEGRLGINRDDYLTEVRFTIHESMAVHLATRLMATRLDKHNPHAAAALRKLGRALKPCAPLVARHLMQSADALDAGGLRVNRNYLRTLETITTGWSQGIPVRLEYVAGDGRERRFTFEPRFIEPYAVGRTTYAIGWVRERDALRTLKLERIRACDLLEEERYEVPKDFDARTFLMDAWGIWFTVDDAVTEVILRFSPAVAKRVHETQWHPSEVVEHLPDGSLEWRARVSEWQEMLPWVRGWGGEVEVVAPEAMREDLAEEARALARMYGG